MTGNDRDTSFDGLHDALRWLREGSGIRALVQALLDGTAKLRAENQELREENERLRAKLAGLETQNKQLLNKVLGHTSEKMPPLERVVRDKSEDTEKTRKQRRQANAEVRAKLPSEDVEHPVDEAARMCPNCEGVELRPLPPERSVEYEYVPACVVRRVHEREKLACPRSCGHIVTAEGPTKAYEKARYGPRFIAHVVVAKCLDSIPLYRQAKQWDRLGLPIARSTLTDLFHRAAELCAPLVTRMQELIAASSHVMADETSFRVQDQGTCRRGFIWTFIGAGLILYLFSPDRSGETPQRILGGTVGKLLVDGYTGYNQVCDVEGRERAGCLCHLRRYFFEARATEPEAAQHVLDVIVEIFKIERKAARTGIYGTDEHLELRQQEAKSLMDGLKTWLDENQPTYRPKSPIGRAIRYALNQWDALTLFLSDPALPPDNNESERRLRLIALGRKNYLFAGTDDGARNLAILMSLVVTCEANGIQPEAYLADVLIRMQTHPQSRIDELLPHNWSPLHDAEPTTDTACAAA